MEFKYNVTGSERKRLVTAMAEILECNAKYLGMPTAAYEVDYFTIDKNGTVSFDNHADSDEVEQLVERLLELGFEPELCFEDLQMTEKEEFGLGRQRRDPWGEDGMQASDVPDEDELEEAYGLVVSIPREIAPDAAIENLKRMLQAKGTLIKKAVGADNTDLVVDDEVIRFPWFETMPDADMVSAVSKLIGKLLAMAKSQKRIVVKEEAAEPENEKYAFRCYLLRLGFIGDEYKAARKTMLRNLSGSSAFKSGSPKVQELVERINADADLYDDVMSLQDKEADDHE